jgi:hypothetical protein
MDQCVCHCEAVRRGAPHGFAGIVVCGHKGLTPQSSGQLGGHKAQGRTLESAQLLIDDAVALHAAGIQLLLLEAVHPKSASSLPDYRPFPFTALVPACTRTASSSLSVT